MNAYQIMGFIILFNFSVSIIGALSIYTITPVDPHSDFNVSNYSSDTETAKSAVLNKFFSAVFIGFVGGIIFGSVANWLTNVPGDSAYAYSLFASFYWVFAANALDIFWGFANTAYEEVNISVMVILIVFTAVLGIAFLSFLIELVKGPWAGMK